MATTFYTDAKEDNGSYVRAKCVYSTSSTATSLTVKGTVYLQHKGSAVSGMMVTDSAAAGLAASSGGLFSQKVSTAEVSSYSKHSSWTDVKSKAFSFSIAKEEAAKTVYLGINAGWLLVGPAKSKAITVPALASYKVTYDANGGSGAPAAQTKWYGEALTLSYTRPARAGYAFKRWNTSAADTGTAYAPGAAYKANAALALHAIWVPYPVITSLAAERCTSAGVPDDDGGYALVTCEWSIDPALGDTAELSGVIATNGSSRAFTFASGGSGAGGTATAIVPDVDPEFKYVVTVTAANGQYTASRSAVVPGAAFMLDFAAGGGAVGIGCPAPASGLEVGFDADFQGGVSVAGAPTVPTYEVAAAWAGNEAAFIAALPRRPCIAISTDGYELWFDGDPSTDSY